MIDPLIFLFILLTFIVAFVFLLFRPHFKEQNKLWKKVQALRKSPTAKS